MLDDLRNQAWRAVHGTEPPPDAPADPVGLVVRFVPDTPVTVVGEYRLGNDEPLPADCWRELVIGRNQDLAQLAWVLDAANMAVIGRGPEESWLLFDLAGDADGAHVTLEASADGRRASLLFPSVEALLEWAASHEPPPPKGQRSSGDVRSAELAFELLSKLHPAKLLDHLRQMTWPKSPPPKIAVDMDAPDWRRFAIAWSLAAFHNSRKTSLPPRCAKDEIGRTYERLLERLREIESALTNDEVPPFIADLSLDDDDEIATAALEWMIQFDRRREQGPDDEAENVAEQTKGIMRILGDTLDELVRLEYIEVDDGRRQKLLDDLLEVVLKTTSPNRLLENLIEALIESRHVDEVFAADTELLAVFAKKLGMGR